MTRIPSVIIAAIILIIPALFDYQANAAFELPKLALLFTLAVPALIVAIPSVSAWQLRSPVVVMTLVWLVVLLAASTLSLNPPRSLMGSYERQAGALSGSALVALGAAVALSCLTATARWRLGYFIVLSSIVPVGYGLIQRAGLDRLGWLGQPLGVTSTFGSSTALGGFLAAVVPWTLATIIRERHLSRSEPTSAIVRAGMTTLLCGQIAVIGLTSVRGAIIAVALGIVVTASLNAPRLGRINWRVLVSALVAILVVAGIALGIVTAIRGEGISSDSDSQAGDASFIVRSGAVPACWAGPALPNTSLRPRAHGAARCGAEHRRAGPCRTRGALPCDTQNSRTETALQEPR
jgi:hypothetical protein